VIPCLKKQNKTKKNKKEDKSIKMKKSIFYLKKGKRSWSNTTCSLKITDIEEDNY
jgi:hypothetical protein